MAAIFALLSSLSFGTIDFIGGHLSKKHKVMAVAGAVQLTGFIVGVSLLLATGTWEAPTWEWNGYFVPGLLSGIIGFTGLNAFFAGLSTGRMGVVSPISSLSVLIPVIYSLIQGERPHLLAVVGIAIAILGTFLGSGPEIKGGLGVKPLIFGAIAALCFGTAVLFLTIGAQANILLTMTTMRIPNLIVVALLAIKFKTRGEFSKHDWLLLAIAGIGDMAANIFLGQASTMGLVSVSVVLASLYPVVTALWAFKFAHERLHKLQYVGIACAIAGVS
ncbi:MAG: hypothetical protein RL414_1338, partial [Actinomycetota bacterium]